VVWAVRPSTWQRRWAATSALLHGVRSRTEFRRGDAEEMEFEPGYFDVVWSVECTEHLFDKPRFFQRAATWLRPGGIVATCAWLAGDGLDEERVQQVHQVCEGFLCPSLGTRGDYESWMQAAGLEMLESQDWTQKVMRTWEICRRRVERTRIRWLAQRIDRDAALFLDRFAVILAAYQSGAMRYGCFVSRKPTDR
jgi:tocopherol O-methyltransferase